MVPEIDQHVEKLLKAGVVRPSCSPWVANLVIVKKKDGELRFCADYRDLNSATKKDAYPLPNISTCLDALSGSSYFSAFDLRQGYLQVRMSPEDVDKTSFVTRRGTFAYTRMPFGLCNAGSTFQRVMDAAMAGLNFEICLVYLDDIIVMSKTVDEMLERLRAVLERLRMANLKLKPSKCQILQTRIEFLGHVITKTGVETDPKKVSAVREWPTPKNVHDVRAFLGLCSYYRRFVPNFAADSAPLCALTGALKKFEWTPECTAAMNALKEKLTTSPILALPRDAGGYTIDCDASNFGIGCVLSQGQDGEERVIAYASRLLSKTEKNYCVTRRELLAVVYFVRYFKHYLLGRKFLIRTDHSALRWLRRTPDAIGQQARWLEILEGFDYDIIHRAGRLHGNADAMSRVPCRQCQMSNAEAETLVRTVTLTSEGTSEEESVPSAEDRMRSALEEDTSLKRFVELRSEGRDKPDWDEMSPESADVKHLWAQWERISVTRGLIYRQWYSIDGFHERLQLVVPFGMRQEVIQMAHKGLTGGHFGPKRTKEQVQRRCYWPGWANDVENFCSICDVCTRFHQGKICRRGKLQDMRVGAPWERLSIDLTGPHPRSTKGNVYTLTVICHFTKWAEGYPIRNKEAATVARVLVDHFIAHYGMPKSILSDQGSEFCNHVIDEVYDLLNIRRLRTTSYHPSCNGAVERLHRTMNAMLAKMVKESQRDWDVQLPFVMSAYRAAKHTTTGFSPNMLVLGREVDTPLDALCAPPNSAEATRYGEFVTDRQERMHRAFQMVRDHLKTAICRNQKYYDVKVRPAAFRVGEWVYYYLPRRVAGRSPKWESFYQGPFLIVRSLSTVNFVIQRSSRAKLQVVHVDKLKKCVDSGRTSWLTKDGGEVVIQKAPLPSLTNVARRIEGTHHTIMSSIARWPEPEANANCMALAPISRVIGACRLRMVESGEIVSEEASPSKATREHKTPVPQRSTTTNSDSIPCLSDPVYDPNSASSKNRCKSPSANAFVAHSANDNDRRSCSLTNDQTDVGHSVSMLRAVCLIAGAMSFQGKTTDRPWEAPQRGARRVNAPHGDYYGPKWAWSQPPRHRRGRGRYVAPAPHWNMDALVGDRRRRDRDRSSSPTEPRRGYEARARPA